MFDNAKKGITPVIAIVLLLMMTVGAVGGAYAWFSQIIQDAQDTANQDLESEMNMFGLECYNPSGGGDGIVKVFLENTGGVAVKFQPVDMIIFDGPTGERAVGLSQLDLEMSEGRRADDPNVDEVDENTGDLQQDARDPDDLAGYKITTGGTFEDNRQYQVEFRFDEPEMSVSETCTAEDRT